MNKQDKISFCSLFWLPDVENFYEDGQNLYILQSSLPSGGVDMQYRVLLDTTWYSINIFSYKDQIVLEKHFCANILGIIKTKNIGLNKEKNTNIIEIENKMHAHCALLNCILGDNWTLNLPNVTATWRNFFWTFAAPFNHFLRSWQLISHFDFELFSC